MLDIAPSQQAATWLGTFGRALEAGDIEAATNLFVDDCYWRDLLTFTWNIKTVDGQPAVREMLKA
ncbi:MAG: NAD(P)/FAD-dependent oxidoreductase, partial [Mesorhizobium sp.]